MRGKSDHIVCYYPHDPAGAEGDYDVYGPYTKAQAEAVKTRMERHIAKQAEAEDADERDDELPTVSVRPISKWKPPPIQQGTKRPFCPHCKQKMTVWWSQTDQMMAECKTVGCEGQEDAFVVEAKDGKYVFVEPEEEAADDS